MAKVQNTLICLKGIAEESLTILRAKYLCMKWYKKSPDSLLIVSVILILMTGLTWVIPAGTFDREVVNGRTVVVPGTYHSVEAQAQGFGDLLKAPLQGFESAAEIIAFVLLVGGAFSMMTATGALDAALFKVINMASTRPNSKLLIIAILMTVFSFAGMTFGMSEETLVFVLLTLPLARSMGYDAIVGLSIPFLGAGVGFAGAAFNPFTVGIAQGIAGLGQFSGAGYRLVVWTIFTAAAILFVLRYAKRLDQKKEKGIQGNQVDQNGIEELVFTGRRRLILLLFLLSLVAIMIGAIYFDWYIPEICALFIVLGVLSSVISSNGAKASVDAFYEGVKTMLPAAIIIAISKSILVVAEDGQIIDTILFHVSAVVEDLPAVLSVQLMFLVQGMVNFFIPSGSGQAAITMPIMTPLSDIIGISRQTAVLAYQFGDGLFNLVIPTSGVTMGVLSIAGVPFNVWLKWVWKLMVLLTVLSMVFLAVAVSILQY